MSNYTDIFNARGDLYNRAMELCPGARENERNSLTKLLQPEQGEWIADAPAGGGYLAEELIKHGSRLICIEPSALFAEGIREEFTTVICPIDKTPFKENTFHKLGSLAGLHHVADKNPFFVEAYRLLKPDGIIAVADVQDKTAAASFLNGFVDRHTNTGHQGNFFRGGEVRETLQRAGFVKVEEQLLRCDWEFPNEQIMVEFCWNLFGLVKAERSHLHLELSQSFSITKHDNGIRMEWSLLYARGVKP